MLIFSTLLDFQVISAREVIKINRVRLYPASSVRTLDVIGEDFRSVDEVLINEIASPDVVVLSRTRLLAQVPDTLTNATLTSVSVISQRLAITEKSFIKFRISRTPGKVTGIMRLVQLFLKILFTTPGTDIFSPKIGGGGLKSLGSSFGLDEGGDIVSGFIISVDNTARQIIQIQSRRFNIPPDERLLSAKVIRAGYNRNETALLASVELLSQAGRVATARLEL